MARAGIGHRTASFSRSCASTPDRHMDGAGSSQRSTRGRQTWSRQRSTPTWDVTLVSWISRGATRAAGASGRSGPPTSVYKALGTHLRALPPTGTTPPTLTSAAQAQTRSSELEMAIAQLGTALVTAAIVTWTLLPAAAATTTLSMSFTCLGKQYTQSMEEHSQPGNGLQRALLRAEGLGRRGVPLGQQPEGRRGLRQHPRAPEEQRRHLRLRRARLARAPRIRGQGRLHPLSSTRRAFAIWCIRTRPTIDPAHPFLSRAHAILVRTAIGTSRPRAHDSRPPQSCARGVQLVTNVASLSDR